MSILQFFSKIIFHIKKCLGTELYLFYVPSVLQFLSEIIKKNS